MRLRVFSLLLSLSVLTPAVVHAQDFGVVESAETVDVDTFKLRANPMFIIGKNGQDDEVGVAISAGYGFTDRFDLEGSVAFYDGFSFFGANGEYWVVKDRDVDFSIVGGLHFGVGDETPNTMGVDLTFVASKAMTDRLDLYGALDFAFESIRDDDFGDESYTPIHLVPGIEYKVTPDLDFVAEFGIGLTDEARHYVSGGLAFYFR